MLQAKIHIVLISLSTGEGGSSTGVLLNHTAATRRRTFDGTVAKLAMRQPFVLFKGLTFQKLCL
ncbi:hypothetical protein ACQE73_29745, partial [Klebsiella pneumoniae]